MAPHADEAQGDTLSFDEGHGDTAATLKGLASEARCERLAFSHGVRGPLVLTLYVLPLVD